MIKKAANARQFRKMLQDYTKKVIPEVIRDYQVAIAYRMYVNVVQLTPVLTGHARWNWVPSINTPNAGELEGVAGVDTTGENLTSREHSKFQRIRRELLKMPLGQTLWITNNVPYIQPLEDGWSQKAPEGMARVALHSTIEYARNLKVSVNGIKLSAV